MIDPKLLARLDRPVPRYTSYPTAPQFQKLGEEAFLERAALFAATQKLLSLYIHIPFCKSMCLFCACSVLLNRSEEKRSRYLAHLLQEIALFASQFSGKREVAQLHLGGGTPTQLTQEEFRHLMHQLREHFLFSAGAELSIEVDPRTVFEDGGEKLATLRELGFTRVSFGVQDLDPKVQEAVKRRQSEEMTFKTHERARALKFSGINVDLIYGLPFQTRESMAQTAEKLVEMGSDRIAFYSYAKVPWLKPHQRAIPEEALPSTEEKFAIYLTARERFLAAGYVQIGMDHFAKPKDSLAKSFLEKKLTRNFQGYSVGFAEDMVGFGVTSIGFFENGYFQNEKELSLYEERIAQKKLPIARGFLLQEEDLRRRFVIQSFMCHFALDKEAFYQKFARDFDTHFAEEKGSLLKLQEEGLLEISAKKLQATLLGSWFIRLIASQFDRYLTQGKFSKAV